MPQYAYEKDFPFGAFITNLGKYNKGELVGEWVRFPTTYEEMQKVFERIGIGSKDDFGNVYEEWFITDYDCYVDGLYNLLGEYENLDELNYLASVLDEMNQAQYEQFQAAVEIGDHTGSIQDLINLADNLDNYIIYPEIHDYDDLGRYYIEEMEDPNIPEYILNYIDYEAYGRDIYLQENGTFTDQGYVVCTSDSFQEYYDGDRESIPEEYKVMSAPEQDTFSIYQIPNNEEMLYYTFESLDRLHAAGLEVSHVHYELVYTAPLSPDDSLESIYTRFNIAHPKDYKGRSLSVSDVVVLHQDGKDTAYYCDSVGFEEVPQFWKDNPLRTAEMTIEDDYGMIDGVINNGRRGEELEQATESLSIRDRLAVAKQECADRKAPEVKHPDRTGQELDNL